MRRWLKKGLPRTMTQREAESLLREHGWVRTQGGKHVVKMEKEGCRPVTLPMCAGGKYSASLTARILKQAGLR